MRGGRRGWGRADAACAPPPIQLPVPRFRGIFWKAARIGGRAGGGGRSGVELQATPPDPHPDPLPLRNHPQASACRPGSPSGAGAWARRPWCRERRDREGEVAGLAASPAPCHSSPALTFDARGRPRPLGGAGVRAAVAAAQKTLVRATTPSPPPLPAHHLSTMLTARTLRPLMARPIARAARAVRREGGGGRGAARQRARQSLPLTRSVPSPPAPR